LWTNLGLNLFLAKGFFGPNVPVDNLEANNVALKYFIERDGNN
jgi:hypothetical protein